MRVKCLAQELLIEYESIIPFLLPGQNTVTTYVSISAGIIAGIILVACLLKCFWRRKKSSYLPSGLYMEQYISSCLQFF